MSCPARGEVWLCERPHDKRPVLILTRRITKLDAAKMRDVCRALNAATGC